VEQNSRDDVKVNLNARKPKNGLDQPAGNDNGKGNPIFLS
jgi:hypothetical protein